MNFSNEQSFMKNKNTVKPVNQNSALYINALNYRLDNTNINLSSIKKDNSSKISSPIFFSSFPKKASIKFKLSNTDKNPSQIQNTKTIILSSFDSQIATKNLQVFLIKSSKENIEHIVDALKGTYRVIMKNKYGNYFCSDLFKVCEQNERIKILNELSDHISEDCCDKYGSYSIQTLIDFASCEDEYKLLLHSFNDYNKFFNASIDPVGSYTIQKIIEHIPEKFRIQFNSNFISTICFISIKKYGIINAKKFISCIKDEESINQIINLISNNFLSIAMNNYGNYFIQFILEKWNNRTEMKNIKNIIIENYVILYKNKYSTFICQLFIKLSNDDEKKKIDEYT